MHPIAPIPSLWQDLEITQGPDPLTSLPVGGFQPDCDLREPQTFFTPTEACSQRDPRAPREWLRAGGMFFPCNPWVHPRFVRPLEGSPVCAGGERGPGSAGGAGGAGCGRAGVASPGPAPAAEGAWPSRPRANERAVTCGGVAALPPVSCWSRGRCPALPWQRRRRLRSRS